MKTEDLPDLLLAALVLMVLAFALSRTAADPDLWGHVRFGQDILAAHAIPRQDPYSFTSDQPWINHEWLAEVLMAGAYGIAGSAGLIVLKLVLAICTFFVVWRALRRAGVFRPVAVGLLLVAAVGVYPQLIAIRPQLFSVLLFASLLALLNGAARSKGRLVLWMPALFALWANLHGGWIVGQGVLLIWSICAILTRTISWPWAAVGAILAIVGTLATPYGLELWRFLWETVGLGRTDIQDWQPLVYTPSHLIGWGLAAALAVMAWRRRGRAAMPQLAPAVALGLLALRVVRLEGFFALAAVILLAPCFTALGPQRLPLSRRPTRTEISVVGAMCLAGFVATGLAVGRRAGCIRLTDSALTTSWAPEAEAVTFLQRNALQGRLLSWFDYGEMAIWHLAPKLRVSYDGRRETAYSERVRNAHLRFYFSKNDASYARILKADFIWLPHRLPVIGPLQRDGWVVIFRGSSSVVLAQEAGPYTQPMPWTGPRCFPGPY